MKLCLTDEHYRYGSYRRQDFKPDILYGLVSFGGMEALFAPAFFMARDHWVERHRAALDPLRVKDYEAQLQESLKTVAGDDVFFEEICGTVLSLRRRFFAEEEERLFLLDAEEPNPDPEQVDIDQSDRWEKGMEKGGSVFFLLADARYAGIMREDVRKALRRGLRVYAAASETERGIFPRAGSLRRLFPEEGIRLLACEGPLDGLEGEEAAAEEIREGWAFILYYGERGMTDCRNLAVPALVRCVPESLTGKTLAGQFLRKGRCDLFVPPHFDILPTVPLSRRTLASFRQFADLSRKHGDRVYALPARELYRRWPEAFFSVYDEENSELPEGAAWPGTETDGDWYADFCNRRDAVLSGLMEKVPGVHRLGGWFALDTMEQKPVPWTAEGEAAGILVHGALLDRAVDAEVLMSDGEAISPRKLTAEMKEPGPGLILNYLFFLTPRLGELYDRLRTERPEEQANLRGGHLDYMLCNRNGRRVETFPLFRKACMAMKNDGTFAFFHFRLGGGACGINGQEIRWSAGDVDPANPGETAVYTPYLSCGEEGNRFTYAKAVGAGRVNFVILQDRLICARDGDVLLPGIGAVISLEREKGLAVLQGCGFAPKENGYFSWETAPEVRLTLDPPEGFSREAWQEVRWAYGGGLTLIQDGESCFADEETASLHLAREGWLSPLSAQTQESDIAAMVRHPRTAIGLTRKGRLFALVFSGRSSVSAGADYREMCRIAKKLVPDVKDLMNVDGGGSALLAVTESGRFFEYSCPSASPGTPAGMVRPINTVFRIRLRNT